LEKEEKQCLQDIAIFTGGEVISEELGLKNRKHNS
jgi:chaperonin GroEL (HSP60 family)